MDLSRRQVLQGAATASTRRADRRWRGAGRAPGAGAAGTGAAAARRAGGRALPGCLRALRPVRARLPAAEPEAVGLGRRPRTRRGHRHALFRGARDPLRDVRGHSLRQGLPHRRAGPRLTDINQARMGVAVLIDEENCLNFLGLRCDVCYRVCPVIDKAITLEKFSNPRSDRHAMLLPTVHAEHCTGCGKCEKSCVLEQAAIKVLPYRRWRAANWATTTARAGKRATRPAGRSSTSPCRTCPSTPCRATWCRCVRDATPMRIGGHAMSGESSATPSACRAPRPARHPAAKPWPPRAGGARTASCCCAGCRSCHPGAVPAGAAGRPVGRQGQPVVQPDAGRAAADRPLRAGPGAGHAPCARNQRAAGCAIVVVFYALVGGRVFCSWVCPVNVVTDAAAWLRRR
jgi:ferredoxin-type protein NapG